MYIIGLTGTIGAGKGAVVDYLVEHHHARHYSVRDFLLQEITRRGLEPVRENMSLVANEFRKQYGSAYIIEQLYKQAMIQGDELVILESLRTVAEIALLRNTDHCSIVAVDADRQIRYKRIVSRGSSTDGVTMEEFIADEEKEMQSTDPGRQNLSACIRLADVVIQNDGTLDALHEKIEGFLGGLGLDTHSS
jgi:dephospho-CoA kinase